MSKNKVISLNKEETNFKNKKHRKRLYERTFLKHNIESRFFTLQKEVINFAQQSAEAALNPNEESLMKFAEALGDVETCIEYIKISIPSLQEASNNIKYQKLNNLKKRTDEAEEKAAEASEEEKPSYVELSDTSKIANKAIEEFNKIVPKEKGFFDFFRYLRQYFSK